MIWFSDNITNIDMKNDVNDFSTGAVLLTREVQNPQDFGVAIIEGGEIKGVVEKPSNPPSNIAVGGIYLFDQTFWQRLDAIQDFTDFSISDITNQYISEGDVKFISVGENTWIDCGTPENLLLAAQMVEEGKFTIKEG